jgi:hypothetical protein
MGAGLYFTSVLPRTGETAMSDQEINDEWISVGEYDPPPDLSREEAAYQRERERLVRDHLGKVALVRFDEVVGVFANVDDAITEGVRLFGFKRMIFREITASDEPEYIGGNVDVTHPCVRRLGPITPVRDHGNIPGAR